MPSSAAAESHVSRPVRLLEAPPSFRDVYRRHYTFVWRSLLRLGVDESAVDDAVQDVFIVVHRKLDVFEGRAAVRTWVFAIARRIALRYRDRARRRAQDEPEADTPTDRGRPDKALSCNETLQQLQDWLGELDEDKRAVFVLSEFEQMRAPEIASMLGANLNTVYARLRAARQHVARRARRDSNMEGYRASVRSLSDARPSAGANQRTWCLLVVELGIGTKAAVAGTGLGASLGLTSGFLGKVAIAAAVIGGTTFAAGSIEDTATPSRTVALASAEDVTSNVAKRPHRKDLPGLPIVSAAALPIPAEPAEPDVPLAPSMVALLAGKAPAQPARQGTAKVNVVEAKPNPFAAELERFEQAKVAARRNDTRAALDRIDSYLREFPEGTFSMEAAALQVRTLCKAARTDEAKRAATAFQARFGSSKLVNVAEPCGNE